MGTYATPSTMVPPQGGSGTFVQGVAPAQNVMDAAAASTAASGTFAAQGVAPAQNMTYAASSAMALPQVGSGTFAQGIAPAQNVTYEAVGAAQAVSSPPITYAAPPPVVKATRTANSDEFKTQVKEAVSHGDEMITISTKMAVGLIEKGIPGADPNDKPIKVTKARRTGGCC